MLVLAGSLVLSMLTLEAALRAAALSEGRALDA